jgi:hypothetical protein
MIRRLISVHLILFTFLLSYSNVSFAVHDDDDNALWAHEDAAIASDLNSLRAIRNTFRVALAEYDARGKQNPAEFNLNRGAELVAQGRAAQQLKARIDVKLHMGRLQMNADARLVSERVFQPIVENRKVKECRWRKIKCLDKSCWAADCYMATTDSCDNGCSGEGCKAMCFQCEDCTPFNVAAWLTCGLYPVAMAVGAVGVGIGQGAAWLGALPGRCICPEYQEKRTYRDAGVNLRNEIDDIETFRDNVQTYRRASVQVAQPAIQIGQPQMAYVSYPSPPGFQPPPAYGQAQGGGAQPILYDQQIFEK